MLSIPLDNPQQRPWQHKENNKQEKKMQTYNSLE